MKEKQMGRISPRVSPSFKAEFIEVAEQYGPNPSAVMKELMQALISAHNKHAGRLVWPLELNYYPDSSPNAQELRLAENKKPS